MHTNAAWDTSTNREWPSICFTKSTVSCKSWGKIWQRKPFLQHEDDSTLYIIYLYMINRTIPRFSMNYHISPSWFCLKQLRESFPLPVNPLGGKKSTERPATIPSSVFACPHPSLKRTHTTTDGYGAKYFSMASKWHRKKYRRMFGQLLIQGKLVNMSTSKRWHGKEWNNVSLAQASVGSAPSAPSERPPCFLGCAWSHPTFHQRYPRTSKRTFTQNANRQTN